MTAQVFALSASQEPTHPAEAGFEFHPVLYPIKLERIRFPGHALTKPEGFFIGFDYACFSTKASTLFMKKPSWPVSKAS